ncbi:hypothetical protein [Bacillus glycinifermentans]|nr:hypothetical protein [Bacillus glycinifermentans]MEC0495908.1 hypothetical protein [Bacillus glycinifermentans]MEC0542597.1 hypothetical protein [Bacillus glycinifermentans]
MPAEGQPAYAPRRTSAQESPGGLPVIDEKTPGVHSTPAEARQQ